MISQRWPTVAMERRAAIAARTTEGATCTLLVIRHPDGQLGLYFHGTIRCSAMLPPAVHAEVVAALIRLAE